MHEIVSTSQKLTRQNPPHDPQAVYRFLPNGGRAQPLFEDNSTVDALETLEMSSVQLP